MPTMKKDFKHLYVTKSDPDMTFESGFCAALLLIGVILKLFVI